MEAHVARTGMKVRVKQGHRKPEFDGMMGIVKTCFGQSSYTALDVELEDGRLELFWFYQLDEVDGSAGV